MDEFESRTHENDQVRIHASNHKTDYKYGSSVITLEANEDLWMRIYKEKFRHFAIGKTKIHEISFFLKLNGVRHTCSDISFVLNYVAQTAGCNVHVSVTMMRKSASTAMYKDDPTQKSDMAVLMDHDQVTAQLHYKADICKNDKSCIQHNVPRVF